MSLCNTHTHDTHNLFNCIHIRTTESWELSECRSLVQDEVNSAVAQAHTSYSYDNHIQSNIADSQYSLHTPHYFPDNFEIPMLNHSHTNTSSQTYTPTTNSGKLNSPSIKYLKSKYYRKRPKKLLKSKVKLPLLNHLTPSVDHTNTTETNNSVVSPKYTLTTKSHSDSHVSNTNKTVCNCDDSNFKLFREIELDYHPLVIINKENLLFLITPYFKICRFQ